MIPKPAVFPQALERERLKQKQRAAILYRLRGTPAGKLIRKMMDAREKELRVAHYASEERVSIEEVAENKGAYTELMLWHTALFDFELNDIPED